MLSFDAPKRGLQEKLQGLWAITVLAIKLIIIKIEITLQYLRLNYLGILSEICYSQQFSFQGKYVINPIKDINCLWDTSRDY